MSSSAKHQLTAASSSDRQKDGSASVAAGTVVVKELDTAGRVSEQLVKQVEVNYSPDITGYYCLFFLYVVMSIKPLQALEKNTVVIC